MFMCKVPIKQKNFPRHFEHSRDGSFRRRHSRKASEYKQIYMSGQFKNDRAEKVGSNLFPSAIYKFGGARPRL